MRVNLGSKPTSSNPNDDGDERPDIDTPERLGSFLRGFYADIAQDSLVGPMFTEVAQVDWATHLPKIELFWSRFLFGQEGYEGNPMTTHMRIHAERPFTWPHFARWLEIFHDNLDAAWFGPNVNRMKKLASNVARVHSAQLGAAPPESS